MTIPNNYRQLKPTDRLRKGDLYRRGNDGAVLKLLWNNTNLAGSYGSHTFWRRRHTKYVPPAAPKPKRRVDPQVGVEGSPKVKQAVVEFSYLHNGERLTRNVQLISLDDKYLTGLEITPRWDVCRWKMNYQFKKYLRLRILDGGAIILTEFK